MLRCSIQDRLGKGLGPGASLIRRALPAVLVLWVLILAMPSEVAAKGYRYEEDPIRLGKKALQEGRLEDARASFDEAIQNKWKGDQARFGMAEVLRRQGKYAEAETFFRGAIAERAQTQFGAQYSEATAGLGVVLLQQGKVEPARKEFETALGQDGGLWDANYGMALILIGEKRYDEARPYLNKGRDQQGISEGEDQYRFGLALIQFAQGDLADAEKNALLAFTLNPNESKYGTLVAQVYTARGAPTLAIDAYERALDTPGVVPTAEVLQSLGLLYEGQRQFNDALRRYREAIQVDSTYAPPFKSSAKLYALAGQYDKAAQFYLRYTQLTADDPEGWFGQAEAFTKLGSNRRALEAAEKAYSLDSTDARIRLSLARTTYLSNDIARAERLYASVPDTATYEAGDWVKLAQIALAQKKLDQADAWLARAIQMDPNSADALSAKAKLFLSQQKPDSAVVYYKKSLVLNPNSALAKINLGVALLQLKRPVEGARVLREAVTQNPDAAAVRIFLGQALVMADSLAAAMVEYKRAMELDPKSAAAMRGAGFIYLRRGDYAQAETVLSKAAEIDPMNADGWASLGSAQSGLRKIDAGMKSFEKALTINPNHEGAKRGLEALKQAKAASGGK